jgi:hypothetical protein
MFIDLNVYDYLRKQIKSYLHVYDHLINREYIYDHLINREYIYDHLINREYIYDHLINREYIYDHLINREYVYDLNVYDLRFECLQSEILMFMITSTTEKIKKYFTSQIINKKSFLMI